MQPLGSVRNQVGESPLWSAAEQALYWVDIEGRRVHRFAWASRSEHAWALAERIGCIALHAAGGLVAAMETGVFHLRLADDGSVVSTLLQAATFPRDGMRFNDGRCDRAGRLWLTSMVRDMALADASGALFRLDADGDGDGGVDRAGAGSHRGLPAPVISGLVTGNGLGFSPDGRTMYLSDSHPSVRRVWAFDLSADGQPSQRRVFIDFQRADLAPGRPDGAAVDAEGGYWICANDAGLVHRFWPDGRLDRSLRVPAAKPSMCAFGGPALDELFITTITPGVPVAGYEPTLAGAVFVTRPGVRGLAEAPFGAMPAA